MVVVVRSRARGQGRDRLGPLPRAMHLLTLPGMGARERRACAPSGPEGDACALVFWGGIFLQHCSEPRRGEVRSTDVLG